MMDKKFIIENGLLEQYLLGELNDLEEKEVYTAINSDAELKSQFKILETSFENLGLENAVNPHPRVKSKLMTNISKLKKENKVRQLDTTKNNGFYLKIVASILILMMAGGFWIFSIFEQTKNQLKVVENEKTILLKEMEILQENIKKTNAWYAIINSPDTERYLLKGNELVSKAKVVGYVNRKEKSVLINTSDLPALDEEHDYQMWADVEGEMINMGILDKNSNMLAMAYIDNSESLNITIEPAGGSDHPNVSNLVANAYLNSP